MNKKFELGQLVATAGIADRCGQDNDFLNFVVSSFNRYLKCDWGELYEGDKAINDNAVEKGGQRIVASYTKNNEKIWIITEWDRSATTILFPQEY